MPNFQDSLNTSPEEIIKEIEASNEKEYYAGLKKRNKGYLVDGMSVLERERVAQWIIDRYNDVKPQHNELSDKIDEWDEVFRMTRTEPPGSDGDMPNYRTPLSTVALEVIHANEMNTFFTPMNVGRVLPTEEGDVPKVNKLSSFLNWSADNELNIFEQVDRLFHNSDKNGECPYLVHWVKEYGTEIKRELIFNPANPGEPLIDPETQEPLYTEVEERKLLYNGPKLEIFSRKDYYQPKSAVMDRLPEWEMRKVRITYDEYLRDMLQGKMYADSIQDIMEWDTGDTEMSNLEDYEGNQIPVGRYEQEFLEFYGRMRIKLIKTDSEDETVEEEELEDEFIALVHIGSQVLCSLRKNKFPLKMRPIGMDYFIPDDEGRRSGIGVMEFLDSIQKAYDALFNQFIFGTVQGNNPIIFFSPTGNQRREPIKLRNGFAYPTSDPRSVQLFKLPPPDQTIGTALELIIQWSQLLFGISDFTAGIESRIDPTGPAKKAEIVVAQGNVRMNQIIKRKEKTLKDIFKRWFLLYSVNMPPNKFMRIVGESEDNPWKFENVSISDFALKSIPDFELTGNVLTANKNLEVNKRIAIYTLLIQNPFFSVQTQPGIQALHSLTKWLIDGLDEIGLSRFLPEAPGERVNTPEEENARFLQGDHGDPEMGEDHIYHIRVHRELLVDPTVPEEIKAEVLRHINKTVETMKKEVQQQIVLSQTQFPNQMTGGGNGRGARPGGTPAPVVPAQQEGMAGPGGRVQGML